MAAATGRAVSVAALRAKPAEVNKKITTATSYQQILDIAVEHSDTYDSVNTATSLHRIAKQRPSEADVQACSLTRIASCPPGH